jgi:hypothetical protein
MAYVAVSRSPILVREVGGAVDPGWGVGEGGHPSHPIERPGRPVDPGWGVEGPVDPGFGVPLPPVIEGGHPDQGLPPTFPVKPGHELPRPPHIWPRPPRPVRPGQGLPRPPLVPVTPEHPIYLPVGPDQELPLPPGAVWPPLPPDLEGELMCFVWVVGVGWRWTVIDTSLKPEQPLPPTTVPPAEVDNTLPPPPTAQPKL